jgi:hypothetical protein
MKTLNVPRSTRFYLTFDFKEKEGYVDVTRPVLSALKRNPKITVQELAPILYKIMQTHGVTYGQLMMNDRMDSTVYSVLYEYRIEVHNAI